MKKRICAMIVLLAFCMGCLPYAQAENTTQGETSRTDTMSITVVNPLYADVIDADDLVSASEDETSLSSSLVTPKSSSQPATAEQYENIDEAAAFVRSQMVNRQATIAFSYEAVGESDEKVSIVKQIVQEALDETDNLTQGDYLRWQYGGYSCNIQEYIVDNDDGTSTYHYKFIYTFTYYTTADQERELNTAIEQALDSLDLDGATTYQKIERIYNYVCQHVDYDYDTVGDSTTGKYTAYSALIKGTAVCQGYALLMYRMLREEGISIRIIAGIATTSGENHAWNIVCIGDSYYYLDSTWDSSAEGDYAYFLRGSDDFTGHEAWDDYTTQAFQTAYPISANSYTASEADAPNASANVAASGTCGSAVTWSLSNDGVLTLRGSGDMSNYTSDGAPWAGKSDSITSVDIGYGITSIGTCAFYGCSAIDEAIVLPDSVTTIGAYAFADCTALPSVDAMANVTIIGVSAFSGCSEDFVLRGSEGSAAETFAAENSLSFTAVSDIADADIALSQQTYTYTGSACTPTVTASADGTALDAYTVSYLDNVNAGTAQVVLTGTGAYGGKTAVSFTIEKAVPQVSAPSGLMALRGQSLDTVLLSCRFAWQTAEESVGMQTGAQTFQLQYTPSDTDNYETVTIDATVEVRDTIGISSEKTTTHVGAEMRLIAAGLPTNAPQGTISWSSSNEKVATISSDGTVDALAVGTTVITATSTNGEIAKCTLTVETLPFTDVSSSSWYFNAVSYAYANGMFAGVSATTFKPKQDMTRAMLVQVLYNQEGKPEVTSTSTFDDVADGKWYTDAVVWASENGVVSGVGNNNYAPSRVITRQEAAQILYNYAAYKGYSTSLTGDLSSFNDAGSVSSWAISAMQWAVGYNLISGVGNEKLAPKSSATRSQLAQIMMQFDYNIVFG